MASIILILSILISLISISSANATRQDWSDLDEGEHEIYGSEKEEKYPVNIFFIEKEDWTNHYSFHFFWFIKTVDYPKYESFRLLPFYYSLKSKIDNRKKTIITLFPWYNRIDGDSKLLVTPLYYSDIKSNETDRSILYLFWWGDSGTSYLKSYSLFLPFLFYKSYGHNKDSSETNSLWINPLFYSESNIWSKSSSGWHRNFSLLHYYESDTALDKNESTFWAPIIPLTYHYASLKGGHRNFFWLLDYSWERDKSGDRMKRFWFAPLVFWKDGEDGYSHVLPPIFISTRSSNGESYTHLLPVFIYKKNINYEYDFKTNQNTRKYTTTSISLFHYKSNLYSGEKKWDGDPEKYTAWYPIIPLFYTHRDSEAETHRNLFWLFDWQINKEYKFTRFWFIPVWFENFNSNSEYRHILPPVFISYKYANGEYYRHFLPFLYFSWKSIDQYNTNVKDKAGIKDYSDSMISPPYCSFSGYRQDEEYSSKYWFPIVPLFYRSSHMDEGNHTNILWIIDWGSDNYGSLERIWFIPIWFEGLKSEKEYRYILPPVFISYKYANGEYYRHFLPFLYFSWNNIEKKPSEEKNKAPIKNFSESMTSLAFCSFKDYKQNEEFSSKFWFPIVPLFYRSSHMDEGNHTNILWIIDWGSNKHGSLERIWFIPIWFEGLKSEKEYRYILPPVFISYKYTNGEYYRHFLPFLYFSWKSIDQYNTNVKDKAGIRDYSDSMISPPYCSFSEYGQNEEYSSKFWLPIVPLFYRSTHKDEGSHTNLLWMLDWSSDKQGSLERVWFIPIWFEGLKSDKEYRHILPPVYMSFKSGNGEYYRHLLPLLYFSWNKIDQSTSHVKDKDARKIYSDSMISLAYCSFNEYKQSEAYSSKLWLPIVPLFYRSTHKDEGYHTNMLWLIDWANDKEGSLERFWLLPFVFHQTSESGYRYYIPFYFRPSGNTEQNGKSFSILHYHKWSPEERIMWLGPCYVQLEPEKKEYFGLLLPFYTIWKSRKSKVEILFPWSITYEDAKRSWYVNIFGISRSAVLGPLNPEFSLGAGTYKGKWYVDTDISWLYNVFSFSTRLSIDKPWGDKEGKKLNETDIAQTFADDFQKSTPTLQKKKTTLTRENSEFFWGYKLLFGWFSYERGDSKRHIRLIPLWWFTWDKDSEDKLYTVPFAFLSYKSQELDYFILFPFYIPIYGHQKEKDSYAKGFLINVYWDEYNAEEKYREQTILWPFINWYSSPQKSGWRFFPFAWHKEYITEETRLNRNIILPLLFYSKHEIDRSNNLRDKFVINPFYYSSYSAGRSEINGTTMLPILPVLYYSSLNKTMYSLEDNSEQNKSSIIKSITNENTFVLSGLFFSRNKIISFGDGREEKEFNWFLLGFYSSSTLKEEKSSLLFGLFSTKKDFVTNTWETDFLYGLFSYTSGKETKCYFIPFWYYFSSPLETHLNILLFTDSIKTKDNERLLIFPLWYSSRENGVSHKNILGIIDWKSNQTGAVERSFILPLYLWFNNDTSHLFILPLLSYFKRSKQENTSFIAGAYFNSIEGKSSHGNILGLVDWKRGSKGELERSWFLPLYLWYNNDESHLFVFPLLGYFNRSRLESTTFLAGAYFNTVEGKSSHLNILGLIDWKYGSKGELERSWVLPLYLWLQGEESNLFIFPLLIYFQRSKKESTSLIAGMYFYSSESYERQNLFYLFDHKRHNLYNSDSYRFLLGTIHYETDNQKTEWDIAFGLFMNYKGYKKSDNYQFDFLLFLSNWKRDGDFWSSSVMPLWYYSDDSKGWSFLSPIALSYFSKDKYGDLDLGLLGLLYLRYNNMPEKSDTRSLLLGTLYWERKKPERGYQSYGSFWGALWDYETESENDFTRFTILGGLFKRVKTNEDVKYTVFWII